MEHSYVYILRFFDSLPAFSIPSHIPYITCNRNIILIWIQHVENIKHIVLLPSPLSTSYATASFTSQFHQQNWCNGNGKTKRKKMGKRRSRKKKTNDENGKKVERKNNFMFRWKSYYNVLFSKALEWMDEVNENILITLDFIHLHLSTI